MSLRYNNENLLSSSFPKRMANPVPSFTVIDDLQDDRSLFPVNSWENQYQANPLSPPPNAAYPGYEVNEPTEYHLSNYDTLTFPNPMVPDFYKDSIYNNIVSQKNLRKYNMQTEASAPLPKPYSVPLYHYPYGTPYPTDGFGAYDNALMGQASVPQFYNIPGVPLSSVPALQDARDNPSVRARPVDLIAYADTHFREGYQAAAREKMSCTDAVRHVTSCEICNGYLTGNNKYYLLIIGVLTIVVAVLLYMVMKKK